MQLALASRGAWSGRLALIFTLVWQCIAMLPPFRFWVSLTTLTDVLLGMIVSEELVPDAGAKFRRRPPSAERGLVPRGLARAPRPRRARAGRRRTRWRLRRGARGVGAAAVFVGCLVGAAVHRAKQVKISHVHETMADMASAREAGEALAAAGDTRGARELLGAAVSRWTSHERTVRYAIWTRTQLPSNSDDENAPERLAAVFEDAQHVASHLRAAYGSLLVEDNRPKEAVSHLTAVCPSIWFFSRRNGPGAEHLRGEVSWLRCYADLMDARKMLGQSDEVGVLERDVVTHSTAWLRRKRDRRRASWCPRPCSTRPTTASPTPWLRRAPGASSSARPSPTPTAPSPRSATVRTTGTWAVT